VGSDPTSWREIGLQRRSAAPVGPAGRAGCGHRPGLTTDKRQRLKLERENCELRRANEITGSSTQKRFGGVGMAAWGEAVEFAALEWVDWFNHRRLLEPIGDVSRAEYEARYSRDPGTLHTPSNGVTLRSLR
jgi:hypothetical protein